MITRYVCPITWKERDENGCVRWSSKGNKISVCAFWENDPTDGEHCRIKRAIDTTLARYDKSKDRYYNRKPDIPF